VLAAATTKAAKASWDQVAAVQQATVGLRAYEKDGTKVNAVLADLIKYARSDLGVLFNRKDLFQSAQMLKINGVETKHLSGNVQILSRSVATGLGNWDDLNRVVGRVISTGRLTGVEFELLSQSGFKLDKSLRNTNISAQDLFKALNKGMPVSVLEGQANTIRGLGIRLETAFRGIGDAILGVDADTSKFIAGGLGDRLTKGLGNASKALKELKPFIADVTNEVVEFGEASVRFGKKVGSYLEPKIAALSNAFRDLAPTAGRVLNNVVLPLANALGGLLVRAAGGAVDVVTALVRAITPLARFIADNRTAVVALAAAYAAFSVGLKIDEVLGSIRMGFIASTIAATGFRGALTVLSTAVKGFFISLGPVGLAIAAVSLIAAGLAAKWSEGAAAADRQKAAQDRLTAATNLLRDAKFRLQNAELGVEGAALEVERATKAAKEATAQYGAKSLEAREADLRLRDARLRLKGATYEARDATKAHTASEAEYAKSGALIVSAENKIKTMQRLRDTIGLTPNAPTRLPASPSAGSRYAPGFNFGGNAKGTDNWRGGPSWVGEKGPEIVDLPKGSRVIPNHKTADYMQGSSKVNNIGQVNISNSIDGQYWLRQLTNIEEADFNSLTAQGAI
jgi:hypothetical protein